MTKQEKSTRPEELQHAITSEDVLGKDVIDPRGTFIGVTDKLLLSPETMEVLAISVDKGFLKKGLVIGIGHIKQVTPHAVLLATTPASQIRGMAVFCSEGTKAGTVESVVLEENSNAIQFLRVKTGTFGGHISIPQTAIEYIESNVMLNTNPEELKYVLKQQESAQ